MSILFTLLGNLVIPVGRELGLFASYSVGNRVGVNEDGKLVGVEEVGFNGFKLGDDEVGIPGSKVGVGFLLDG